ncbi:hypothetical protein HNQ07_000211 [Deinococcus metalli]|uniref:Uncharacterized protein n=1 Tax=Deinococcus metalli TaxID=1141878 RepID=A0A7W8NQ45_9DEIO|nr:hypothetical protein [Deinococcus metalli]MBB5374767.1 hypothetical protein [Deinococcus metalli]GHF33869.1 hypothetical protein GCM10017781_08320 [Deinococcus metalli]
MNDLLCTLTERLPDRICAERQGSVNVYSVFTEGAWIPVYQVGASSGWWLHGERHLEYGLREEAEARGWDWRLESASSRANARVSAAQRMCSEHGHQPVYNLACAVISMLDQTT